MFPPYSGVAKKEVGRTMSVSAKHYYYFFLGGAEGVEGMFHLKSFEFLYISD